MISRSPTDVQPVFETIVESAARLCDAQDAVDLPLRAETLRARGPSRADRLRRSRRPLPLSRATVTASGARAAGDPRRTTSQTESDRVPVSGARRRDVVTGPCSASRDARGRSPIGVIVVRRTEVRPFTDRQIALLQTFADQAVIAIENVRLFTELQTRNRELTDSLDAQTATAEILRVISQAPTDVQPVFEAIADSVMRLLGRLVGLGVPSTTEGLIRLAAARGGPPGAARPSWTQDATSAPRDRGLSAGSGGPRPAPSSTSSTSDTDPRPGARGFAQRRPVRGFRSVVAVPMLRDGDVVGVIGGHADRGRRLRARRDRAAPDLRRPGGDRDRERAAAHRAAGQERHLTEALEQQTATSEILRVISQLADRRPAGLRRDRRERLPALRRGLR